MALKVDLSGVKTFFFERGEKIGMIACVAAAAVLVGYGVMSGMGTSTPYPAAFKATSKDLRDKMEAGQPIAPLASSGFPTGPFEPQKPGDFWGSFFHTGDLNNTKRLNPRALAVRADPEKKQIQIDYIRGPYFAYEIDKLKKNATTIKDAKGAVPLTKGKFGEKGGTLTPVTVVQAKRMLVVNCVFPLTEQLEEFRKAFRMANQAELFASRDLPRFLGINVEKCEMTPGKEPVWTPLITSSTDANGVDKLDIDPALMDMLREAIWDEQFASVGALFAFQGLVMPLPKRATLPLQQSYPKAALEGIDHVWEEFLGDGVNPGLPVRGGIKGGGRPAMDRFGGGGGGGGKMAAMPNMQANAGAEIEFESVNWLRLLPEIFDKLSGNFYALDPQGIPHDPEEGKAPPVAPPVAQPKFQGQGSQAGQSPFSAASQWAQYPAPPQPAGAVGVQTTPKAEANAVNIKPYEALVRFVDVDVKPGKSYKYKIQVRIANPNFGKTAEVAYAGLAQPRELPPAPPVETPVTTIPEEYFIYAIDQKPTNPKIIGGSDTTEMKHDQVAVQIHRWADRTADRDSGSEYVIGDWVVAERLLLRRGDAIGRTTAIEIPLWDKKHNVFELGLSMIGAAPAKEGRKGLVLPPKKFMPAVQKKDGPGGAELGSVGVPVEFAESTPSAVLVDFTGGKESSKFGNKKQDDESATNLLILTSDGKLIVRNTRADSEPDTMEYKTRQQRIDEWNAKVVPFRTTVNPANPSNPGAPRENIFMQPKKGGGG